MWVNDIRHGEGTMRWFDKNQVYTGQWENGVQVGFNYLIEFVFNDIKILYIYINRMVLVNTLGI